MHIQPNHSVAFVHLFRFLSFMFVCWTEGAAGLRRMPHKQTSGAARTYSTHLHEGCIRQDSFSLQSGSCCPTASLESLPALRFRSGSVVVCQSHRNNRRLRPRLPSSTTSFLTPYHQYKSGLARNLRKIGEELGVAHVVEGSVQRAANKIRVNAQLIDARNDAHLWPQTYDRDLADVFAIQSEIAKAIANQLQAKLSPNEKKAIEQPPTTDLAAFDLYSRAKSLVLMAGFSVTYGPDVRKAIELLDEAVKRDPSFFDAYCQLAYAHEYLYGQTGSDHTPARLALAEAAVQAATRLRPDAAETHLARAQYLYYGLRSYAGALAQLEIARRGLPNDPRLFELTGYILRRRGQQEEGLRNLERAAELDPRNFNTLQQIALSYQALGRYAESVVAMDRASAIVPDNAETRANRELFYLCWKADTRPLRQTIDAILAQGPGAIASAADTWFFCALAERDPAA